MIRFFILFLIAFFSQKTIAQTPKDLALPLQITTGINPPAVFLSWENPQPSDIALRRRPKGSGGGAWTELVNAPGTLLNGYFDTGLDGNQVYEYALERRANNLTAYGYGYANFFAPVVDSRGKILVFIDSTTADLLGADLITFKNDLRGEGWQPVPFKTGNFTTVQWVKNQIVNAFNADPGGVKAVLLMGNVPVPYSGSMAWDTKPDHIGAWPCDAYYGDVNGAWTDNTVDIPNTSRAANRNVPGDGKFDQSVLPSGIELAVGRLDFRRLSAANFGLSPVELLRRYLFKNHLWRSGQYKVPKRAVVDDVLGWSGGEAFAADGFRNAYPLTGPNGVVESDFHNPASQQRYLLGYGCGWGSYDAAGGVGASINFAFDSVRTVFAQLYGDYFGDWDFESNPLLPSFIAARGGSLAAVWAGRPHWFLQGLASGEPIGFCLRETQNAQYNPAYGESNGESGAHIALIGDPTLRATIVSPVSNLSLVSNCNKVNLHWTASPDSGILGYLVYRSFSLDGPYQRLTPDLVFQTSWDDTAPVADTLFYSVRAVKLEVTPGGGAFYNASTGAPKSVVFVPGNGPTAIALGGVVNCNIPVLTLGTNFQPPNCTVQWYKPNGQPLAGFTATEGGVYTVVVTAPNGCTVAAYATVFQDTILPEANFPSLVSLDCAVGSASFTVPAGQQGVQFFFNGVEVFPGMEIPLTAAADFLVKSNTNGCSKTYHTDFQQDFSPPGALITHDGLTLGCANTVLQLMGSAFVPNCDYAWSLNGGTPVFGQILNVAAPGEYCLTVTGVNQCTSTNCVTVQEGGSPVELQIETTSDLCAAADKTLDASVAGGTPPFTYAWSSGGTGASTVIPAGFSGNVTVTVTDAETCSATATEHIGQPVEVFAITQKESAPGAMDGAIDLLVFAGQAPFSYLWSNGATTEDIAGLAGGAYSVTVTGADACSTTLVVPLATLNTGMPGNKFALRISPNPVRERLGVFFENALPSVRLRLLDLQGQVLAEKTGENAAIFQFDTAHLPEGMYLLWVESAGRSVAYRVAVAGE